MKVVVALNRRHFHTWCRDNNQNPYSRELVFISTDDGGPWERLMGLELKREDVIKYGPYYEGRYCLKVVDVLETRIVD